MFHINMFSLKKHERLDRTRLHHFNCFYEVVKLEFNIFIWYNILLFVNQFDNLNAKHLSNMIIFCIYLCGVLIEILATRNCVQWLHYIQWLRLCLQGSPHLQKTGRLDFLLREHEGKSEGMTGRLPTTSETCFRKQSVVSSHHFKKLHLKCDFANILHI